MDRGSAASSGPPSPAPTRSAPDGSSTLATRPAGFCASWRTAFTQRSVRGASRGCTACLCSSTSRGTWWRLTTHCSFSRRLDSRRNRRRQRPWCAALAQQMELPAASSPWATQHQQVADMHLLSAAGGAGVRLVDPCGGAGLGHDRGTVVCLGAHQVDVRGQRRARGELEGDD